MARRFDRNAGGGPSQRQLRVGELIRRRLSEVLARGEVHDPDLSGMSITVGEVQASADLKVATAHVLPLGGRGAEVLLEALHRNRHEIRRQVAKGVALKFSPELRFRIDDTFDRLDDARRLFSDDAVRRDVEGPDDPEARLRGRDEGSLDGGSDDAPEEVDGLNAIEEEAESGASRPPRGRRRADRR